MLEKHTTGLRTPPGCIAYPGLGRFDHRFGGRSWSIRVANDLLDVPALLLVLDLTDPSLSSLMKQLDLTELPLCSYINCDAWQEQQVFQLDIRCRQLVGACTTSAANEQMDASLAFPNPLPERSLLLRSMREEELPSDEAKYWSACDSFLGGNSFIRVSGPILWLQDVLKPKCRRGHNLVYIAAVGHENLRNTNGIVAGRPFFIGESALYFFFCKACGEVSVFSQPS